MYFFIEMYMVFVAYLLEAGETTDSTLHPYAALVAHANRTCITIWFSLAFPQGLCMVHSEQFFDEVAHMWPYVSPGPGVRLQGGATTMNTPSSLSCKPNSTPHLFQLAKPFEEIQKPSTYSTYMFTPSLLPSKPTCS